MSIKRLGGRAPKWDHLHEQEMREVKEEVEGLAGRHFSTLELASLWAILSRWAGHRYKVTRNNAWQEEKRRRGGAAAKSGEVLPAMEKKPAMEQRVEEAEEGFPWES